MTDSGSGQRDNQGQQHPGSDDATTRDATSGDDYTPSASWETSRGSSWENTTPYEQYQGPGSYDSGSSTGSGSSASSYGSASPYGSDYQGSAASAGSAADRRAEDGPWPSYPDQSPQGFGQPPSGYSRPSGYASASDPYPQPGHGQQQDQGQQAGYQQSGYQQYGQPSGYGQQPDPGPQPGYGQQPTYGQQPAYGVNPYQQPVYAGYALPNHPQATTAMILGIVGLALCPFVGIAAFVMGGRVRREIDAAPQQWGGRGLATAGWVLGIISIVYAALVVVYLVIMVVVAIASS